MQGFGIDFVGSSWNGAELKVVSPLGIRFVEKFERWC